MFVHIALYKWRSGVTPEQVRAALHDVEALSDKVPGLVEISTGENTSRFGEGYTHVILDRGHSQEAMDAYRAHPDHAAVEGRIEGMKEHGISLDFATRTG